MGKFKKGDEVVYFINLFGEEKTLEGEILSNDHPYYGIDTMPDPYLGIHEKNIELKIIHNSPLMKALR